MTEAPSRDRPIDPKRTALLLIDVQNGIWNDAERAKRPYFYETARDVVIPNLQRLIAAARRGGAEVIYTVIESLTRDGRDRSLDYKLSGFHFPKGAWEAQVLASVAPGEDDIVLPKTSSGLFNSTNFDYVLRNLGVETLIATGFLTDQCVDHTVKDGADRGYYVVCPTDACTTESPERHEAALKAFAGYCRLTTTAGLAEALIART
jgi:nicotinamidase-related amidase